MIRKRHTSATVRIRFTILVLALTWSLSIKAQELTIDLNGTWNWTPQGQAQTTLSVPNFYVWQALADGRFYFDTSVPGPWAVCEGIPESTYERPFDVPANMAGKRLVLRFESVNFLARIQINDVLVTEHIGGLLPFEVDITDYVTAPSTNNTLTVDILYHDTRFLHEDEYPLWPIGFYGLYWYMGITGDVSLIARNNIQIQDLWVRTSVTQQTLTVTAEIVNQGSTAKTVMLNGAVENGPTLQAQTLPVAGGATITATWSQNWSDARLWWPEDPYLYNLTLDASVDGNAQHSRTQRFGFRQSAVSGKKVLLNGQPRRLMGDSFVLHSEKRYFRYGIMDSENFPAIIDSMLALNINTLRFHQEPPPPWMLDVCDEKGMLVIAESAIYEKVMSRDDRFIANAQTWLQDWIRRDRNHPCIVAWSAENEMLLPYYKFLAYQIATWGAAIKAMDPDRPVYYEGDQDLGGAGDFYSIHYLYGFPNGPYPTTSIYIDMASKVATSKPVSHGEFEWSRKEIPESDRVRRMCIKTRTSRVLDWADIRPYRLDWAWHPHPDFTTEDYEGWTPTTAEIDFLKATLSPVAVYDRGYYEYHYAPDPPEYDEDQSITRNLITLNDGHSSSPITVRWRVQMNGAMLQSGEYSQALSPGQKTEQALTFTAPIVNENSYFDLELTVWQDGVQVFSETAPFLSRENGVALPPPPMAVQGLLGERQDENLALSWSPVTLTGDGLPASVSGYRLYLSDNPDFPPGQVDSIDVGNVTAYVDAAWEGLGDPTRQRYYQWRALDGYGQRSPLSEVLGVIQYQLATTATTDFNAVATPVGAPGSSASQWLNTLDYANSMAQWCGDQQGYAQYAPTLPVTDFALAPREVYYLNVTTDTLLVLIGTVSSGQVQLTRTEPTAYHTLMVPLDRSDLATAAALASSIGPCNTVSRWNTATQSYVQYVPSVPATDFAIHPSMGLMVHVTADVTWPPGAPSKALPVQTVALSQPSLSLPHAVWGRWPQGCQPIPQHFSAFLNHLPENSLDETSEGSLIDNQNWLVQTSAFPSGWNPGDTLTVRFLDNHHNLLGQIQTVLDNNPAQEAIYTTSMEEPTQRPQDFTLSEAYPNPFNGATHFTVTLPKTVEATIHIYNIRGICVKTLEGGQRPAGAWLLQWDGRDDHGASLPSGVYLIRLEVLGKQRVKKVVLSQ